MSDTQAVREQYERFPFPPLALGALEQIRPPQADLNFVWWYLRRQALPERLRILDAGCGTGFSTLKLAQANPTAEIVALDLSEASLAIAQQRLQAAGLATQVRFLQADLQALPELGTFDYLHSSGVVHHLPDPLAGLQQLRACLKPMGCGFLMVYSAHARQEIALIQQVLQELWQDKSNWQQGLMLCRQFLQNLPHGHRLKQHYWQAITTVTELLGPEAAWSDAFLVDTYLQRCEWRWTQPEWFALLQQSGWQPLRWLDESAWQLAPYLPTLPDQLATLGPLQRLAIADCLRPAHNFSLFVLPEAVPVASVSWQAQAVPQPFQSVQLLEREGQQLLDNGRGQQLLLDAPAQALWQSLLGQDQQRQPWQALLTAVQADFPRANLYALEHFCRQLLACECVAQL